MLLLLLEIKIKTNNMRVAVGRGSGICHVVAGSFANDKDSDAIRYNLLPCSTGLIV
jgi:hypothetical protein